MDKVTQIPPLPPRPGDGHKGTFGTVLVAAGSPGMTGAAGLCAQAVLRAGAGLCRVALPAGLQAQVAVMAPCATTLPVVTPDDCFGPQAVAQVADAANAAGVLALGPGLGQGAGQVEFTRGVLAATRVRAVVDADGLNCLAQVDAGEIRSRGNLVLTPHPGEAGRLLGRSTGQVQQDREGAARAIAADYGCCCVLKGARTLVVEEQRGYVNGTGSSALATGGSGDVLTGLVAGLAAQGMELFVAAVLGVWLHGRAGELGARELGEWSLTAADLLTYLPRAFKERAGGEGAC